MDSNVGLVYLDFLWPNNIFYRQVTGLLKGWEGAMGCKIKFKRKGSWMRLRRR